MRRAFTMGDFLNVRMAESGDDLEYGRTNVTANMGGECDPVYGFWEHNRSIPVYVPDGAIVKFDGRVKPYQVKYKKQQIVLEALDEESIELVDFSFDPKDWGKSLIMIEKEDSKCITGKI